MKNKIRILNMTFSTFSNACLWFHPYEPWSEFQSIISPHYNKVILRLLTAIKEKNYLWVFWSTWKFTQALHMLKTIYEAFGIKIKVKIAFFFFKFWIAPLQRWKWFCILLSYLYTIWKYYVIYLDEMPVKMSELIHIDRKAQSPLILMA